MRGVIGIAWSPDGSFLATASHEELYVWRTDIWEQIAVLDKQEGLRAVIQPLNIFLRPDTTRYGDEAVLEEFPQTELEITISDASKEHEQPGIQTNLQHNTNTQVFDVFLCYNEQDRPAVKQIGDQLKQYGVLPWLDEWELPPGLPREPLLEQQIKQTKAAAVFVGQNGFAPWQRMEMDALLREFADRGCPVIPVLLPDASAKPELPPFLKLMTWVDFHLQEPDPLQQLL